MLDIARNFINLHKNNKLEEWQPLNLIAEDQKLNAIYLSLINGVYGEVTIEEGQHRIEINTNDSINGNSIEYFW